MSDKHPFVWSPDECLDLGELGEHEVTFGAWIDSDPKIPLVDIFSVTVKFVVKGHETQEVDVTVPFKANLRSVNFWAGNILRAFLKPVETIDEGA